MTFTKKTIKIAPKGENKMKLKSLNNSKNAFTKPSRVEQTCHPEFISGSKKILKQVQNDSNLLFRMTGKAAFTKPSRATSEAVFVANANGGV